MNGKKFPKSMKAKQGIVLFHAMCVNGVVEHQELFYGMKCEIDCDTVMDALGCGRNTALSVMKAFSEDNTVVCKIVGKAFVCEVFANEEQIEKARYLTSSFYPNRFTKFIL